MPDTLFSCMRMCMRMRGKHVERLHRSPSSRMPSTFRARTLTFSVFFSALPLFIPTPVIVAFLTVLLIFRVTATATAMMRMVMMAVAVAMTVMVTSASFLLLLFLPLSYLSFVLFFFFSISPPILHHRGLRYTALLSHTAARPASVSSRHHRRRVHYRLTIHTGETSSPPPVPGIVKALTVTTFLSLGHTPTCVAGRREAKGEVMMVVLTSSSSARTAPSPSLPSRTLLPVPSPSPTFSSAFYLTTPFSFLLRSTHLATAHPS
mmetsp:Transcript_36210/g.94182  ORF Transcript_36210/g.94182 Transcript_36210/m.94182 type:complete len:263 (-) Transcript_36210:27-815(-)